MSFSTATYRTLPAPAHDPTGMLETNSVSETGCEISHDALLESSVKWQGLQHQTGRPRRQHRFRHARSLPTLPTPCPSAPQVTTAQWLRQVRWRSAHLQRLSDRCQPNRALHGLHNLQLRGACECQSNREEAFPSDPFQYLQDEGAQEHCGRSSLTPAQQASQVGPAALVPRPSLPRAPPLTTCANADILGSLLSTTCPSSFQRAARTLGATFYIQERRC
jgi:hypothetical protein